MMRKSSCLLCVILLASHLCVIAKGAPRAAQVGSKLEETGGKLEIIKRDLLISNPGTYGIPDEQLHFPWLYESASGIWYLTYREGPHHESIWRSAGNRVRCIQSRDKGRTWLPWMGMKAEALMYQFFVTRLQDGSLISYRCRMTGLHKHVPESQPPDGTTDGMAIVLRSADKGATWTRQHSPVTNLPFSEDSHLITLCGKAIVMPDCRLLWGVITRERNPKDTLVGVVESTDGGRSFRYLASLCHDVYDEVGEPREPGIALLPSGELVAVLRCSPMIQVRSTDGGRTWSPPRKLAQTGICPQLLRLENGVLICSSGKNRRLVHIMASWDGTGRQWSKPLLIYEGQTGGYSNLQSLAADRFVMCYQEGTFNKFQEGGNRLVRVELKATSTNR